MDVRNDIKQALSAALAKVGVSVMPQDIPLESPTDVSHGDYASGVVLSQAKKAGLNPRELAEKVVSALGKVEGIRKMEIAGPGFINFFLSYQTLANAVSRAAQTDMWGAGSLNSGKKIMVEYTDPNPFKEFHIGHLMSNAIGESISRLLQFSGAEVKRANYQGDVGPHVAKAIWGVLKLNEPPRPGRDMTELIFQLQLAYPLGSKAYDNDSEAKKEIDEINKKIYEKTDSDINTLYEKGRTLSLAHFEELYKILGTKFDFYFFESATAPRGIEIVRAHPEVFTESDGAIVYKGEQDGLHTRVFITSKGLPTYEAKDLGLAELKTETWPFDVSVTITAQEQADYFAVVLAAMKKVLPEIALKIKHVSHGMMRLPTGKMSSRTGDVITGESLLTDLTEAAKVRASESRAEDTEKLAQDVAVAAIKYQILKQGSGKDIIFDQSQALSLEGDSGPYLQYAYARTLSLLQKAQGAKNVEQMKVDSDSDFPEVAGLYLLSRSLINFPYIVERAAKEMEPHHVTTYLIELASIFSSWYATERIIVNGEILADRIVLIKAVTRTLKNGLWILGIPSPEKM